MKIISVSDVPEAGAAEGNGGSTFGGRYNQRVYWAKLHESKNWTIVEIIEKGGEEICFLTGDDRELPLASLNVEMMIQIPGPADIMVGSVAPNEAEEVSGHTIQLPD